MEQDRSYSVRTINEMTYQWNKIGHILQGQ